MNIKTLIAATRRRLGLHPMRRSTDIEGGFDGAQNTQQLANIISRDIARGRRHDDVDLVSQVRAAAEARQRADDRRQLDMFEVSA